VEGSAGASGPFRRLVFPIALDAPGGAPVTARLAVVAGTAGHQDLRAGSTLAPTVTIPAGETRTWVSVDVLGDTYVEPDEGLSVRVQELTNARVGTGVGQGLILNDDDRGAWFASNRPTSPRVDVAFRWGDGASQVLACDTDGDGIDGPVTFRGGSWRISAAERPTASASGATPVSFGAAGDVAVCGDWDGDGRDGLGVYRPAAGGRWYLRNAASTGPSSTSFLYGRLSGDLPVVGDWDRDGRDEPAIFRAGSWHIADLVGATPRTLRTFTYGSRGDLPLAGDWDGDGRDGPGLRRTSNQRFYLRNALSAGLSTYSATWGLAGDRPVIGDWDEDGRDTYGLVRRVP
jgi:hypothetical protein